MLFVANFYKKNCLNQWPHMYRPLPLYLVETAYINTIKIFKKYQYKKEKLKLFHKTETVYFTERYFI